MAPTAIAPAEWLEALSEPALVVTVGGAIVASNSAFRRITGALRSETPLSDLVTTTPDDLAAKLRLWARTPQPAVDSLQILGHDGPYDAAAYGSRLSGHTTDGQPIFILLRLVARPKATEAFRILNDRVETLAREIAARVRAEQAVRESEVRFRTMADSAPVLIWLADPDGMCTYVNHQWIVFSGRRLEDELGRGWRELLHPDDREECLQKLQEAFGERAPFSVEYRLRRADGQYRWLLAHGRPRALEDGTFSGYVGSCTDITERRNAEAQLRELNALLEDRVARRTVQLRDLAMRLAETEQNERRRVAQVLHDELQQYIVAAGMRAEIIARQTDQPPVHKTVAQIRELLEQALRTSRSLTMQLSPPVLHEAGLAAGLAWLVRWMRENHHLQIELQSDQRVDPLPEAIRVQLFLSARELLFNVVKHAQTNRACLTLSMADEDRISVEVRDEGCGFVPEALEAGSTSGGFGLFSLRERVDHLGGEMHINSTPGHGTAVRILVPRRLEAWS